MKGESLRELLEGYDEIFIDRERELSLIKDSIDLLINEKKGGMIVVSGSAGTGKSHLTDVFKNYVRENDLQWLEGVCISRDGEPFQSMKDALRAYRKKKRESYINLPLSIRIADRWKTEEDDQGIFTLENRNTLQSSLKYLIKITDDTPFVFLLEDMHWADKHTLLMLRYLAGKLDRISALFICTYRPEDSTDYELLKETMNFLTHGRQVDHIRLEPFDREETRKFISEIIGFKAEDSFVDMFHESTNGNPLFIKETVDSMLANKTIDPEAGKYIFNPSEIKWPSVVEYIVERKLMRLDDNIKKMLQYLSVLGQRFNFRLINEYMNMDEMDILDILDEITEREILKETADSEEYVFYNRPTRDMLYSSLSENRRRLLHKKAAGVIERCYNNSIEDYYDILADHYIDAGMVDKGAEYLYQAGLYKEENGDMENCIKSYRRVNKIISENNIDAVDVNEIAERLGTNLYQQGLVFMANGDPEASKGYIEEAVEVFSQNGMDDKVEKCNELLDQIE